MSDTGKALVAPNSDIRRLHTSERSSKIVIYNGVVMLSGQTPDDWRLDIKGQTAQVLAKIDALLQEAGTNKSRLLTAQIWLRDAQADFEAMNELWNAWVVPGSPPARATWEARTPAPDIRLEIMVTAAAAA
jgi:enamine deaminase RidA (YjgF/YER057c/UK114 family)